MTPFKGSATRRGSISSRSTLYMGNAVVQACRDAKRQIFELAAPKLGTEPQNLGIGMEKYSSRIRLGRGSRYQTSS